MAEGGVKTRADGQRSVTFGNGKSIDLLAYDAQTDQSSALCDAQGDPLNVGPRSDLGTMA
jgi:hypothetical protein